MIRGPKAARPAWHLGRTLDVLSHVHQTQLLRGFAARFFGREWVWVLPVRSPARDCGFLIIHGEVETTHLAGLESIAASLALELESEERSTPVDVPALPTRHVA
ncbi:MAG: hypothetical protein R3B13_26280 [Polyangiaceae bacterium]